MAWILENGTLDLQNTEGEAPGVSVAPTSGAVASETPEPDEKHDAEPSEEEGWFLALKRELHQQVISGMEPASLGRMSQDQLRQAVRRQAEELCHSRSDLLSLAERERLVGEVLDETFGLGPLESLMRDPTVSDILINGPKTVYVERNGRLERTQIRFHDNQHVLEVVQRIAARTGRRVDETSPTVDARLPDGSRLNAIIPPLAIDGPLVSIRRFGASPLTADDLLTKQSITRDMLTFLAACVRSRINILVSGGTGSGKTTLLNCLSLFIPPAERVATIEDAAELQLQQPHVVRMETRPANVEGEGEVTTYDLVRNALRMRPDRIVVGECRGAEALDMLQAMNTGHEGSMTTIHANAPREAVERLELMVGMAGLEIPMWVIRRQVSSAIHVVVQVARLMGGVRRVVKVSEVTGMEGEVLSMHDLFEFKQTGLDQHRAAEGYFSATGLRPHLLPRLEACGSALPVEMFERRILSTTEGADP